MELFENENGSNDSQGNCTLQYDSTNYKVLAGLRAAVGLFSFLCCSAVIFVIILFKKYTFFSQRLILNIAVAAMIHSFSYTTARVNYYSVREIDDPYCYFGGILNHYSAAVELISIWFTTVNVFFVGMFKQNISKFEPVYYVSTYTLPLLWFWVPIWLKGYGTSGGWCGIKSLDVNCQPYKYSTYIQFGIWFVPLYVSTALIILMLLAVAIKLSCTMRQWKGRSDPMTAAVNQVLRNELRSLFVYPIIYLALNTFSIISQIYRAIYPNSSSAVLPYLRVLTSPLRGALVALLFGLDRDTWSRLTIPHLKKACLIWLGKDVDEDLIETTTLYSVTEEDSVPKYSSYTIHRD